MAYPEMSPSEAIAPQSSRISVAPATCIVLRALSSVEWTSFQPSRGESAAASLSDSVHRAPPAVP